MLDEFIDSEQTPPDLVTELRCSLSQQFSYPVCFQILKFLMCSHMHTLSAQLLPLSSRNEQQPPRLQVNLRSAEES